MVRSVILEIVMRDHKPRDTTRVHAHTYTYSHTHAPIYIDTHTHTHKYKYIHTSLSPNTPPYSTDYSVFL